MTIDLGVTPPASIASDRQEKRHPYATLGVDEKERSHIVRKAQTVVQSVQKSIFKGRPKLASKILTGFGCAPSTKDTADLLRTMHPKSATQIDRTVPFATAQVRPDIGLVSDINKKRAGIREGPYDAFAWSHTLLFHQRNEKEEEGKPITGDPIRPTGSDNAHLHLRQPHGPQ
jgi:hypothetical protein